MCKNKEKNSKNIWRKKCGEMENKCVKIFVKRNVGNREKNGKKLNEKVWIFEEKKLLKN